MQKVIKLFFGLLIFVSSTGFAKAENLLWSMSFFCDEGVSFEFSEVETRDLLSTRTKNGRTLSLKLKRSTNDDNIFSSKNGNVNGTLKRSDKTSAKVSAYFTQNNKNNSVLSPNFGKMTAASIFLNLGGPAGGSAPGKVLRPHNGYDMACRDGDCILLSKSNTL